LDWLGAESAWYVDGVRVAGTGVNVPGAGSAVILNMWGNGGAWAGAGGMAVGGWAVAQVQWIEMVFNVSGEAGGSSANAVVCSVDQIVGMPTVAQNVAVGGRRSRALLLLSVLLTAWMAFV
jgi:beta-glucanase (GH16 family)